MAIENNATGKTAAPPIHLRRMTPEECFWVSDDVQGIQIDAIEAATSRADSTLLLLSCHFDGSGHSRITDDHVQNVIGAVRGEINRIQTLIDHAWKGLK